MSGSARSSRRSVRSGQRQQEQQEPRRRRMQTPQKDLDEFWGAFKHTHPGKIYTILPKNQHALQKREREPRGAIQSRPVFETYDRARRECQAVVDKISKECRRVNQRYRDIHFDMEFDLKMGYRFCLEGLEPGYNAPPPSMGPRSVKRVGQIFDNPKFYVDGATPNDIRQGNDGDCWFLSGLSACCQRPKWVEEICVARDELVGVYGFVFHRDGEWFHTVIDDRLYLGAADYDESLQEKAATWQLNNPPDVEEAYKNFYQTGSKALWFAQCANENETWLPLIEKAYAKAHGDFAAIDGGFTGEAIEDLTGGITTEIWTSDILDTERFWEELLLVNKEFLFGCGTGWADNFLGAKWATNRKGVMGGHAYSIMEARQVRDQRLVKIRNPWGNSEWKGAWSDGSAEWTPEWMELLGHRFGDDGVFWMSYKDLLKKFSHFDRTRLFLDKDWKCSQQWAEINVPWTGEYSDTKYEFDVKQAGRCVIALSQLDSRYFSGLEGQYYFTLKFRLEQDADSGYIVRSNTTYFMSRTCSVELDLEPGTYSVLMKIEAEKFSELKTPEQVVRQYYRTKQQKLLQVGISYDFAHAKAIPYETEEDKAYAREHRRRKREAERKRIKELVRYEKWKDWDRRRRQKERLKRHKARVEEHRRKKEAKASVPSVAAAVEEEKSKDGDSDAKGPTGPISGDEAVEEAIEETEGSGKVEDGRANRSTKPGSDDQTFEAISVPDVTVSVVSSSAEEVEAVEGKEIAQKEMEIDEVSADGDAEKVQETLAPPPEAPVPPAGSMLPVAPMPPAPPPKSYGRQRRHARGPPSISQTGYGSGSGSDDESVLSWATSIDTRLDLNDYGSVQSVVGSDSDSVSTCSCSSCASGASVESENQAVKDDAWNAVCVVGLRVFSKGETVIRVIRPRTDELSLDVDDVSKAISGDKPVTNSAEVHKPSIDGERPPLKERRSFGPMSRRDNLQPSASRRTNGLPFRRSHHR